MILQNTEDITFRHVNIFGKKQCLNEKISLIRDVKNFSSSKINHSTNKLK